MSNNVKVRCASINECNEIKELKKYIRELDKKIEHSSEGISIVDKDGIILRSNTAMQKLYQLVSVERLVSMKY